jgi:light-regulated signal transduction histidine kinase (bacteriophytochrome)
VLKYSTVNAARYPADNIDLNQIIENIKYDLELVIQEKKAILIQDQLPVIQGAQVLIHQLFYNLINNALKFSKADEPPRVTILAEILNSDKGDYVKITIKDNGIGLDPAHSEKIFNAFQRLHSKDEYEGTGLGLALCKKIVDRHYGTIAAVGQINQGADFIVCLPLEQSSANI